MRKINLILTLLVLSALLLAACGGAAEDGETPGAEVTEGLPGTGAETLEPLPGTGEEATETLEITEEVIESPAVEVTEAVTEAVTEPVITEPAGTTVAPGMPGATLLPNPSSLANLLDYEVQNANGDVLGDVDNMVIDLGSSQIQHVIIASGGFLGIGETLIPVPWDVLSLNSECTAADMGAAGAGETDATGTVTETETPAVETLAVATPVGTEELTTTEAPEAGQIPGEDVECFFLLNADVEMLQNAPNFDPDQLPDVSTPGWDAEFNEYWSGLGTTTGAEDMAETATPGTEDTGAAETATPEAGTDQTGAAVAELILAEDLLSMDVVAGAGGGQTGAGDTGDTGAADTETPAVPAETATPGTGETNIGQATGAADEILGTVTDAIVDLETGEVRYLLVSADTALGEDLAGMLIPVPTQAATLTGTEEPRMLMLNVDRETLAAAPAFDQTTYPDTSAEGWDTDIETYWSDFVTSPTE